MNASNHETVYSAVSGGLNSGPADDRFRLSVHCANEPQRQSKHTTISFFILYYCGYYCTLIQPLEIRNKASNMQPRLHCSYRQGKGRASSACSLLIGHVCALSGWHCLSFSVRVAKTRCQQDHQALLKAKYCPQVA